MTVIWSQIRLEIRWKKKLLETGKKCLEKKGRIVRSSSLMVLLIRIDIADALDTNWTNGCHSDQRICVSNVFKDIRIDVEICCRTAIWPIFTCGFVVSNTLCKATKANCCFRARNNMNGTREEEKGKRKDISADSQFCWSACKLIWSLPLLLLLLLLQCVCVFVFQWMLNEEKMQNSFSTHEVNKWKKFLAFVKHGLPLNVHLRKPSAFRVDKKKKHCGNIWISKEWIFGNNQKRPITVFCIKSSFRIVFFLSISTVLHRKSYAWATTIETKSNAFTHTHTHITWNSNKLTFYDTF